MGLMSYLSSKAGVYLDYQIHIDVFDGPFDLLLDLIDRQEVDIWDIPIAAIAEQFLQYIRSLQERDLVVSGDFLVMASTLLQIKARMLLPARASDDEENLEEDPRDELVERLLEYRFFRTVSDHLAEREEGAARFFPPLPAKETAIRPPVYSNPVGDVSPATLRRLYETAKAAFLDNEQRTSDTIQRVVSLAECAVNIRQVIAERGECRFIDLLLQRTRPYIIASFLVVLEMIRHGEIIAVQHKDFGDIFVSSPAKGDRDHDLGRRRAHC